MKNNVNILLQRQDVFEQSLCRVQEANGHNFFLLLAEIAVTQKSLEALGEFMDAHLNATREAVCQVICRLTNMGDQMGVQRQFELIVDKVRSSMCHWDLAFMHFKSYLGSCVSY